MNERAKAWRNDRRRIHLLDEGGSADALTGRERCPLIEVAGDGTVGLVEDDRAIARGRCVLPRGELLAGGGSWGGDTRAQAEGDELQHAHLAHEAVNLAMLLMKTRADLLAQVSVVKLSKNG